MPGLFVSACALQHTLNAANMRFCFIGGIVLQRWGEPRFTQDIDLTLLCTFGDEPRVVSALQPLLASRMSDPAAFAMDARMYLGRMADGTPVDIALGGLPFEERAIERASNYEFSSDITLNTCSAEDLIVMKAFANRERDWLDVESVLIRQTNHLNWQIIDDELKPLAALREDADIAARLDSLRKNIS